MKLIVGLGNPGKEYEGTRHNVGFMCVDFIKEHLQKDAQLRLGINGLAEPKLGLFEDFKPLKRFKALVCEGALNGEKLILAKPQTFMNLSGEAVQALASFYRCKPEDLWIIYDDVDLKLGEIRIRAEGSSGTHNGMKSVISLLGFSNFPRVRIGIESRGESAPQKQDISSFVLHPFSKEETPLAKEGVQKAAKALILALDKGISAAAEQYN